VDSQADLQGVANYFELRYGLPAGMLYAMMGAATNWEAIDPPAGTAGVYAQDETVFVPFVQTTFNFDYDPTDVEQASQAAALFLAWAYNRFGGWDLALAAYDWSWQSVAGFVQAKAKGVAAQLPAATVAYIQAVAPQYLRP
jgi:hypothetical protein